MKIILQLIICLLLQNICVAQSSFIKVYFTQNLDNSYSSAADGVYVPNMDDTIISYIDKANISLDVAVYDNTSTKIINAINTAYGRGVVVRYISSTASLNTALSGLNSNIQILKRSSLTNIMHNKFVVIDRSSANNAYVLCGSMNFTTGNMFQDYNNHVIIKDVAMAQAYTTEFEEMWGSTTASYNSSNSKFGSDKADNTAHSFNINGTVVELYFSPSDGTTSHINTVLNSCNNSAQFGMFTFNHNTLGATMIALHNSGKQIKGIVENVNYLGSEYPGFVTAGMDVLSHENIANSFHHKYGVVDATNTASDPTVITGSHNWTNSAESDYDENTLLIHDATIANQFYEEFMTRYNETLTSGIKNTNANEYMLFPNPANNLLNVDLKEASLITIYNVSGIKVFETNAQHKLNINTFEFANGSYVLSVRSNSNNTVSHQKIIIQH